MSDRRSLLSDFDDGGDAERRTSTEDEDTIMDRSSAIEDEGQRNCCHPNHVCHRMIALILMCFLGFGSFFCYDNPSALEDQIKRDLNITTTQYTNLYSWYSWPNVVCCMIGGFLIDRVFGIRNGTTIFSVLVVIGHFVFALGAFFDSLIVMILGRFIFGIGGESLAVAQNSYAVLWFKGKELNMVFGFQLSLSRLGSTVNMFVVQPMYDYVQDTYGLIGYQTLGIVLLLAGITCVISLLFSLILGCIDKRAEKMLNRRNPGQTDVVKLSSVKDFPSSFWMITIVIVAYYSSIFPFVALAKDLFITRFHMHEQDANRMNSIVYIISAFLSPVMGILVDKTGRNIFWVFLSLVVTCACHALIGFTFFDLYITMVLMGVAYSMVASALWPLIALVIPEYQLGTAYGIAQSVQNLGVALATISAGLIVDNYGYQFLEIFFVGNVTVALLTIIILWIYDNSRSRLLNMSTSERFAYDVLYPSINR